MTFLSRFFQGFSTQVRGNVTITVALAILPITAAIGGGVDFANVENARARLQDAADSAAIAAALDNSGTLDGQTTAANKSFNSNVSGVKNLTGASGSLASNTVNNIQTMSYSATASVSTYVLGLVGMKSININALAKAGVSINRAEIAFVLDNTGSMNDNNKMTMLKSSLDATLASLLDSNGNNAGNTKVALVPFDTQVALSNVSSMASYTGNYTTVSQVYTCTSLTTTQCTSVINNNNYLVNWISNNYSTSAATTAASNVITYMRSQNGYQYVYSAAYFANPSYNPGCYRNCSNGYQYRYLTYYYVAPYNSSGTVVNTYNNNPDMGYYFITSAGNYTPYQVGYSGYASYTGTMTYAYPTAGGYGTGTTTVFMDNDTITTTDGLLGVGTANWSGCVIDRTQPYDTTSDAPVSTTPATMYPASKCAMNSLLPIMDLTTDISSARTYAQKMTPDGNTNITIGIQWGMEVLSPSAPFTNGTAFTDKTVNKYMIVLTDGLNTQNRLTTKSSDIDLRTAAACKSARDLGITVFTVRLEAGNSDMLKTCASQPGYYYNLSNANQISGALGSIMKSIKKVRLTK